MPDDYSQILSDYRDAAEQGDASAQYKLGLMYGLGLGLAQDYAKAVDLYRKSAMQTHAQAQNNLGWMYGTGRGVPQDYVQAYAWYNLAAASGEESGRQNRDLVEARMSPGQLEQAQALSRKLFSEISAKD